MQGDVHINCTDPKSIEQGFIYLAKEIKSLKDGQRMLTVLSSALLRCIEYMNDETEDGPTPARRHFVNMIDKAMVGNESCEMLEYLREAMIGIHPKIAVADLLKIQIAKVRQQP